MHNKCQYCGELYGFSHTCPEKLAVQGQYYIPPEAAQIQQDALISEKSMLRTIINTLDRIEKKLGIK